MPRGKFLTVQRTVYMSEEMCRQLEQLALRRGQGCHANDLIREALRAFLDEQTEVMASRRHFQKSFQARIDQMETRMADMHSTVLFYFNVVIQLLALGLAFLISAVTKNQTSPRLLIQKAVTEARKEETIFAEQVQAVRDMAIPES